MQLCESARNVFEVTIARIFILLLFFWIVVFIWLQLIKFNFRTTFGFEWLLKLDNWDKAIILLRSVLQ